MLIGFCAGLIPKNVQATVNGLWSEPIIIYQLCIADPGSRKTAIYKLFSKALEDIQREFAPLDDKERVIPFMVGAITEEALKSILSRSMHLVASADEFMTIWGSVLKRNETGSYRGLLLEGWNGAAIRSSTKTAGNSECSDSHFGIVAFGQFDMLFKYCLNDAYADGLYDRFLIAIVKAINVSVRSQTELPSDAPTCHQILRAVYLLCLTVSSTTEIFYLRFSLDAKELFLNEVDASRERVNTESDSGRKALLSKTAGILIYICIYYVLFILLFFLFIYYIHLLKYLL